MLSTSPHATEVLQRRLHNQHTAQIPSSITPLQPPADSRAERIQAVQSNDAQSDWDRFLQTDSSRDGGTAEDDGGEETELDAIGLGVLDTVAAKGIYNKTVSCYTESRGIVAEFKCSLQSAPTVQPAMIEGSEPVLAYPIMPPVAVKAARMNAGASRPYASLVSKACNCRMMIVRTMFGLVDRLLRW